MPAVDTAGWSKVHAFFDHDDLVAKIQLEDDTYIIEVCCLCGILRQVISQNLGKRQIYLNLFAAVETTSTQIKELHHDRIQSFRYEGTSEEGSQASHRVRMRS